MKALVGAFNQEMALVGAFSVIVQPVVEQMDHFTALHKVHPPHAARLQGAPAQPRAGAHRAVHRGRGLGRAQRLQGLVFKLNIS